jgi:nucleoid DNA-binding protein
VLDATRGNVGGAGTAVQRLAGQATHASRRLDAPGTIPPNNIALRPSQENGFMTKKEIAKSIAGKTGIPALQALKIVQKTFDAIVATLIAERRIELWGFGVFEVKTRAARNARNPRTGQRVFVPERLVVKFTPGSEMEGRVQSLENAASDAA